MADGLYQSVMCFFIPYLTLTGSPFVTFNGLDVTDRTRLGCYIAHPAVITINLYVLINTYRWDWLMLLVVCISDLLIFFWTGVFTTTTYAGVFYQAAPQVYAEASFWAVLFITPVMCIFPRYSIKALQKVYWPYDVDIIREQDRQGKFDRLTRTGTGGSDAGGAESSGLLQGGKAARTPSGSSETSRRGAGKHHVPAGSVDEDRRPIYPPSVVTTVTTAHHANHGSDATNYTGHGVGFGGRHRHNMSADLPMPTRPSIDRARPSYDRMRASMDRVRPSFEASHDFTSAARLARVESSQSTGHNRFRRLRGLSLTKTAPH